MGSAAVKNALRRVRFGDVVRLYTERCADPKEEGIERYVGLEHIEPGDLRVRKWGLVADGTTFTNRFRPGQVLFGKRRAYLRKVAVPDFEGVCSGDIYVLEPADGTLHPGLLPFLCQTDTFFEHAVGTSAGSLSPRTNWRSLADFEVNLPPLEQQAAITNSLRAVVDHLEALRQGHMQATAAFRVHVLHLLRRASEGIIRVKDTGLGLLPATWRVVRVADAGEVQLGQKREPSVHAGVNVRPYLRVANVFDGQFDFRDVLEMHFPTKVISKYELRKGDILLNEGQSADLVGRSCIWNDERPGTCFQMTLLRFRAGPDVIPEFAHLFFRHCLYGGIFQRTAVQTTSMAHLTAARFAEMLFPLPPKSEQRELVEEAAVFETCMKLLQNRVRECEQFLRSTVHHLIEGGA